MSDISETGLSDILLGREAAHPNPAYDFLTGFIPRKLKDLFKWTEWLAFNSAHVYGVAKKFGEYPITDIIYTTDVPSDREQYKNLLDTMKAKSFLTQASFDKWIYGNVFCSLYEPFKRMLPCPACRTEYSIDQVTYKYETNKVLFKYTCPACKQYVATRPRDIKIQSPEKMNFIRWDPKLMDIDHNPITGESNYYYTIPNQLISAIEKGNALLINAMPIEFLKTVAKRGKVFQFAPGQLYHMKVPGPAGLEAHWGFPPITAAIKLFLFAAILRKANECVSLDTLIETSTGLVPADDVRVGDLVRTHTGNWRAVLDKLYRDARPDEVGRKITLSGLRAFSSTYSPHHPIATIRLKTDLQTPHTSSVVKKNPHLYEEVFIPAEQLTVGDHVLYPRHLPSEPQMIDVAKYSGLRRTDGYVYSNGAGDETIAAFEALERGEHVSHDNPGRVAKRTMRDGRTPKRLPAERLLTPDLGYILGWYAGDGSCNQRNVGFSLGMDDSPVELVEAIRREFNLEATDNVDARENLRTITIGNVILRPLIKGMIPGLAPEKRVPLQVLNGPDAVKLAFLKGYHEADGHYAKIRNTFSTSSRGLAYDVFRMLLHFGCIAIIDEYVTKDSVLKDGRIIRGGNLHYHINTCGPSRERLYALWEGKACPEVVVGRAGYFWKDYFVARVLAVEETEEEQYVDFKIDVDETFCTPGTTTKNSIALDHIVPFRILFPSTGSQQGDPVATINLAQWREEMTSNLKRWRRDPLHMMFSPAPVGLQDIGGQGRTLLTLGELQEVEKNIVLSMGVPMEFIAGGLGQIRGEVTLRMIENQLRTHIEDLNALLQWFTDKAGRHMGWRPVEARLADFKMIDDTEKKQLLISLWQAGEVSGTTVKQSLDIDPDQERKQIKQDAILKLQSELATQSELQKLQTSLGQQAQQQAQQSQAGMSYDQQAVIAQADPLVQELQQLQPGLRRSRLDSLQSEDFVMYSVVSKLLEQAQTDQDAELRAQAQSQGPQPGVAA